MQSRFISQSPSSRRLILIFAGWSTTPSFYRHIHADGWDVAVVWDYTSLDLDASFLSRYSTIFIVAWSMGVAAAAHAAATSINPSRIAAAFAVNGTLYPSSDQYGIPEAVYEGTRDTLSPKNLLKFTKRMQYTPPAELKNYPPLDDIYIPDFESLGIELENMRSRALKGRLPWKRAYISLNDRIFPASSMQDYWSQDLSKPQIINLDAPHYVDLQEIIQSIIPNTTKIAKRFGDAVSTYDDNATAQHEIVDSLFSILPKEKYGEIHDMLEIGVGSGLLSRRLLSALPLSSATFLDLYPVTPFGSTENEKYIAADAEEWIHSAPTGAFDLIATSSTIQWFADPATFFCEAARALRPGGILLCSTFLPGNLKELDARRPSPLLYRSAPDLVSLLPTSLCPVITASTPIPLRFPSRQALLRHLHLTGVATTPSSLPHTPSPLFPPREALDRQGGLPPAPSSPREALNCQGGLPPVKSEHTLTYLPFYILAVKK